ncbi:MAG: hypothetical protein RIR51_1108 [Bacteroidota bacterium]
MENSQEQIFINDLHFGFVEKSGHNFGEFVPKLVVNDKTTNIKVGEAIKEELRNCEEFWFSVAFLTQGGLQSLKQTLLELQEKNIRGKILVSKYLNFTQPHALKDLLSFSNIELRIKTVGNFHSKGYLFRNKGEFYDLIIGSSNLTENALSSNEELNLKISAKKNSLIINNAISQFENDFNSAIKVTPEWILDYNEEYSLIRNIQQEVEKQRRQNANLPFEDIQPNSMQIEALKNLKSLRNKNQNKALLISATGTGKTFLSAFDVKEFNPKKLLFVVHRVNIANAAMNSFKRIFKDSKSLGLFSGSKKEADADFIFSTVQTVSKIENLEIFEKNHFDYIIIDESHRSGADSYKNLLSYFEPKFLLGMTATPERTDGYDIYEHFDHNIAYEIRLQNALDIEILSPFHYFGVTDLIVNGKEIEEKADFNLLTSDERVERIIEKANLYNADSEIIRGLVFCSKIEEAKELSIKFNDRGLKTIALTGEDSERNRELAIQKLESEDPSEKIDYIFTVDIFNEGIDIPKVNQIIMLRPTQSAIIFVQQLGRGLRKAEGKEFLTVIDFIGNYSNNYLIPIALFGDKSFNKDNLRRLISQGSNLIPGTSTINFDRISKEKIFQSIDSSNFSLRKDLKADYEALKFKIGRIPKMMDFIQYGSRDPYLYVEYSNSYFEFISSLEPLLQNKLDKDELLFLKFFSNEINNAKRIEEFFLLNELLLNKVISKADFISKIQSEYGFSVSDETISSIQNNLNFYFINKRAQIKCLGKNDLVVLRQNSFYRTDFFEKLLENQIFSEYLYDSIEYSIYTFNQNFVNTRYRDGFILFNKYSRKDVCRILNWESNDESTIYGYKIKNNSAPLFVNYHKEDNISSVIKYKDGFINNQEFSWETKHQRTLKSKDVQALMNHKKDNLRILLFVKKSNGEGTDFYFIGDVIPFENSFIQTSITNDKGQEVPIVNVRYKILDPVEDNLYNYLING